MRPTMSTLEPAENGIRAWIGRDGQASSAAANLLKAGVASPAIAACTNPRRVVMDASPLLFCSLWFFWWGQHRGSAPRNQATAPPKRKPLEQAFRLADPAASLGASAAGRGSSADTGNYVRRGDSTTSGIGSRV